MPKTKDAENVFGEATARAADAVTLWAEMTRQIAAQGIALGATAAREGARLYADLLESNGQAVLRASEQAQATAQNAMRALQETLTESLDKARKAFTPAEG